MGNLDLWNKVEKTNPKYTKPAKIGGMKITAIAPQYQIMLATEQFGPYGVGFGFKSIQLDYSLIDKFDLVVFKGVFFHPKGEFEIINSSKMYMDRNKTMVDADFAKKIETDTLTKALSKIGFNADVFMGRFDDTKYVLELEKEFNPLPLLSPEQVKTIKGMLSELLPESVVCGVVNVNKIEEILASDFQACIKWIGEQG